MLAFIINLNLSDGRYLLPGPFHIPAKVKKVELEQKKWSWGIILLFPLYFFSLLKTAVEGSMMKLKLPKIKIFYLLRANVFILQFILPVVNDNSIVFLGAQYLNVSKEFPSYR